MPPLELVVLVKIVVLGWSPVGRPGDTVQAPFEGVNASQRGERSTSPRHHIGVVRAYRTWRAHAVRYAALLLVSRPPVPAPIGTPIDRDLGAYRWRHVAQP
jgi:hypothetical protein